MKKLYTLGAFLGILAFGLQIVSINLSDKLAYDGLTVRKIQSNIDKIEEENQVLNVKVLGLTSFETISSKAGELGFVPAKDYITLKNQTKISYNQ